MSNQHFTATGYPAQPPATHAAGGYPYVAPPPSYNANPNPNSYYHNAPYGNANRVSIYWCCFRLFIVSILFFLTLALLVIWIVLRPTFPQFRINSLSLTGFSVSSSTVSGNWTASLTVVNPNKKMHIYYKELNGAVYYRSEPIANNRLAPFDQERKSGRNVSATLVAASMYVDGSMVSGINGERSRGSVKFNLRIDAIAHFKAGWWSRRRPIRVFCDHLPVGISSNSAVGALTGGPQDCAVGN